ncbi:hypothetical protein GCM10029978_119330 [Actinoallomurus acanthiterrae]
MFQLLGALEGYERHDVPHRVPLVFAGHSRLGDTGDTGDTMELAASIYAPFVPNAS